MRCIPICATLFWLLCTVDSTPSAEPFIRLKTHFENSAKKADDERTQLREKLQTRYKRHLEHIIGVYKDKGKLEGLLAS